VSEPQHDDGQQWIRDGLNELAERGLVEFAGFVGTEPTFRATRRARNIREEEFHRLRNACGRLLRKFHHETTCGSDGWHWAECESLVDALGWMDYDEFDLHSA
jgi:hypothetical protein